MATSSTHGQHEATESLSQYRTLSSTRSAKFESDQLPWLLRLPAELRNSIYDALGLQHDDAFWISADKHSEVESAGPSPTPPPIAQSCRLLRAEILPIFYGSNTFSMCLLRERNLSRAKAWIAVIGDIGVPQIRNIRLCGYARIDWMGFYKTDISILAHRTDATSLESTCYHRNLTPYHNWTVKLAAEYDWQSPSPDAVLVQQTILSLLNERSGQDQLPLNAKGLREVVEAYWLCCNGGGGIR